MISILSISAQSNFAVGAVVNATFGSITELTFYITALLRGHRQKNTCLQEMVKAALTGTLLGCILFIPVCDLLPMMLCADDLKRLRPAKCALYFSVSQGICMIIGGIKHSEQRFNSRSAGVSSSLLFISIGGKMSITVWRTGC